MDSAPASRMFITRTLVVSAVSAFVALGCNGESKTRPAPESSPKSTAAPITTVSQVAANPAQQAQKVFKSKCVVCHGDQGAGDGPGAAALNPKPRAFGSPDWQTSATDEQIEKAIIQGGAAVGKSAGMPANPDLRNKPQIVDELVKIVRGFKS